MRKFLLTVALACLVCTPVLAQRFGAGQGRDMSAMLLGNADVQKELKLTDEQKKDIAAASKEMRDAMTKAREDMDFSNIAKVMEDYGKSVAKVKDKLTSEQKKRLLGIEAQQAEKANSVAIFKNADVAKTLKLTEKQKDIVADYEKDVKELMEDAKGDRTKMFAAFQKLQTMGKDSFAKLTKTMSETQKTAWKELKGDEFKLNLGGAGGFRPKGKPKDE